MRTWDVPVLVGAYEGRAIEGKVELDVLKEDYRRRISLLQWARIRVF